MSIPIYAGCVVLHTLSGLYYKCEDHKQARWMNSNSFYVLASWSQIPAGYFDKQLK